MGFLMFYLFPLLRWIASTQTGLSGRFAAPFAQVHKYALATSRSRMSTEAYHVEKQRKRSLASSSHKCTISFERIARGATARRQIEMWNLGSQMNWSGLIVVSGTSLAKPLMWRVKTGTSEDIKNYLCIPQYSMHLCIRKPCGNPCVDCRWSDWSTWQSCSETCGGGTQKRTRQIAQEAGTDGTGISGIPHHGTKTGAGKIW